MHLSIDKPSDASTVRTLGLFGVIAITGAFSSLSAKATSAVSLIRTPRGCRCLKNPFIGSVGTFCCAGLFLSGDGEPLFLQVKEAQNSVLEKLGAEYAFRGAQGRRVVEGQRMMQATSDIFLGWTEDEASGRQFYVRALKNRRARRRQRDRGRSSSV